MMTFSKELRSSSTLLVIVMHTIWQTDCGNVIKLAYAMQLHQARMGQQDHRSMTLLVRLGAAVDRRGSASNILYKGKHLYNAMDKGWGSWCQVFSEQE